jgi:plastocyanin
MTTLSATLRIGALGLLAAAVVGCGGSSATPTPSPEPTPETTALVVEASEFKYAPPELTIPSSGSTIIELVNVGTVEHDLTIDALEFQVAVKIGETATGTLTDVAPGTYEFYCTIPGHKAAGMVGSLVVE